VRKYPIGQQDFRDIIKGGSVYVDKTQLIHTLVESGKYYFLSRPRRFGKSLLLSTIEEIFKGSKDLFEGLWIIDHWDWEQKYPVIHISFSDIGVQTLGLQQAIFEGLSETAKRLGISLTKTTIDLQFKELVQKAAGDSKVVILIDEYDKPIIDNLDNFALAEANRTLLKTFYSILKGADQYIRLLLITGVSRFSKVSIFSDLNNLNDITLHPRYATLTGITQGELESDFAEEISAKQKIHPDILKDMKTWYNGYSWNEGTDTVYNPFSLLNYMDAGVFQNYWFQTGTPSFLIDHMKQNREFLPENLSFGANALSNFDIEHLSTGPLLFQTGYLTIKSYETKSGLYELGYPNKEVEDSLNDALLSAYRNVFPGGDSMAVKDELGEALKKKDIEGMMKALDTIISTIPYDHWLAESESIFHIIAHLSFRKLGVGVNSEPHSAKGRCDIIVSTDNYIYALELKLNSTPAKALQQILKKEYLSPYQMDKRKKIAIGINFSSKERKVNGYTMKEL
jgi:hypothetical protein